MPESAPPRHLRWCLRARRIGLPRFVLLYGVVAFGVSFGVVWALLMSQLQGGDLSRLLQISVLTSLLVGVLVGLVLWWQAGRALREWHRSETLPRRLAQWTKTRRRGARGPMLLLAGIYGCGGASLSSYANAPLAPWLAFGMVVGAVVGVCHWHAREREWAAWQQRLAAESRPLR